MPTPMQNASQISSPKLPWWVSPTGICIGFLLPILILIVYVGESDFSGLTIRGLRYLDSTYVALGAGLLLVAALGGWIGSHLALNDAHIAEEDDWERPAKLVGLVALAAYIFMFRSVVFDPVLLFQIATGSVKIGRAEIGSTVGVTSFVNFGPVFFSLYGYCVVVLRKRSSPVLNSIFSGLLLFTILRVYLWSERLALIEAIIPVGLTLVFFGLRLQSKPIKFFLVLGPYVAIPFLVLYFGIAESVRSWTSATYSGKLDFWEFALGRFASYYYTSLNNGAGVLATNDWPNYKFENTLLWLHKAPLIGPTFSSMVNFDQPSNLEFLYRYGDPEFNNPSGLYSVIFDIGLPAGCLYFFVTAFMGGVLFQSYKVGGRLGILFYPIFFLSFLEVFRYPYLGTPRAAVWILGALVCVLTMRKVREKRHDPAAGKLYAS